MRFPKAAEPLQHWANAVQAAAWKNPGALKADFGSADFVGDLTVFNVGGNKYRLIAFRSLSAPDRLHQADSHARGVRRRGMGSYEHHD